MKITHADQIASRLAGGAIRRVDFFSRVPQVDWTDPPNPNTRGRWPIYVEQGEILLCHAFWQGDSSDGAWACVFELNGEARNWSDDLYGQVVDPNSSRFDYWGVISATFDLGPITEADYGLPVPGWQTLSFYLDNGDDNGIAELHVYVMHVDATKVTGVGPVTLWDVGEWSAATDVTGETDEVGETVYVIDASGGWWWTDTPGTTGGTEPDWDSVPVVGDTIDDGTVTWRRMVPAGGF